MRRVFIIIIIAIIFIVNTPLSNAFSQKVIVIDAMYGGKDFGPTSEGVLSKEITLEIAKKVGDLLSKSGKAVIYTRDEDIFVDLDKRIAILKSMSSGVLISIGINSYEDIDTNGYTLYVTPEPISESEPEIRIASSTKKVNPELQQILQKLTKNKKQIESKKLAESISLKLKQHTILHNRGIKNGLFRTLIETNMPSVLIKLGFITNEKNRDYLTDSKNQEKLAYAIFEGVMHYLNEQNK